MDKDIIIKELENELVNAYRNGESDDRVLDLIEELQKLDADNITLLNVLCDIYVVEEDYKQAEAFANKVLSIEPNNAEGLCNKGMICFNKEKYEEAIKYLKASDAVKANYKIYNTLGDCYFEIEDIKNAKESYIKALNSKDDDEYLADVEFKLGNLYIDEEEYSEALKHFKIAHKLDVEEPVTINNIGICYEMLGELDKALAEYEKANKIDPEDEMFVNNIATVKEKMN